MGQSWADHNQDFMARALRADRITFADLGVVNQGDRGWWLEHDSPEAVAFVLTFRSIVRRVAS
jgi:hypothetical protein